MIMIAYYVITAFLLVLVGWNFVREKKSRAATSSSTSSSCSRSLLRLLRWK